MYVRFFCTESLSFLPIAFAITTVASSETPTNKLTSRPITGLFAPTAATAIVRPSPVKLPTTAISDALNNCTNIAVAATGIANCRSPFQIEPFKISICCFFDFVFNFRYLFFILLFKS